LYDTNVAIIDMKPKKCAIYIIMMSKEKKDEIIINKKAATI